MKKENWESLINEMFIILLQKPFGSVCVTNFGHRVWSKFYWAWDFTHSCEWIPALLGQEFGFDSNPHERKLSIILSFENQRVQFGKPGCTWPYLITLWWSWVHLGHLGILENTWEYLRILGYIWARGKANSEHSSWCNIYGGWGGELHTWGVCRQLGEA